jgi:hypothetical protein
MYILGDDGWKKMFPNSPKSEWMTWSKYRDQMCDHIKNTQQGDGSWAGGGSWGVGGVFTAAVNLTILQLDKGVLPIYQR